MMILKEHNISVRLPQERTIDTGIVFVQNDKNVYKLNIRVFDGVYEIDYTEVEEATITFSKADGKVVQGDMQIEADKLTYVLGTNEIAVPGKLIASIQLLGANERLTTARFLFRVEKDLITEDAVKSTSEFPILQRLVKDVEDTLPLLPEIEETIEKFPQIQEFFDTAQAAENQRISNEIIRQSQESVRQAKIIEIEERFQRLTSQQQHDAEVIDARDGEISLRARLDRDHAEFESHKADKANPHNVTKEQIGLGNVVNMRQVVAVGGDNMSRNDTTWWANSIPNDDKNYINSRILGLTCGNNGLFVFGDATTNARRFGIQVGHSSTSYSNFFGTLELNPIGGGVRFNGGGILYSGLGNPEGRITAPVGSLYLRTDGSANNTLYVKESGTGNVGWVAK